MPDSPAAASVASALIPWFRAHARDLPWRRADYLERYGAWGVLVSEFMLQQTPVTRVIPHLEAWLARWPDPSSLASATGAEVLQQWANLGYPRRALWLHGAAIAIRDQHGGSTPREVTELLALPGIGDYTARAVAAFAFGDRHPVVDTNTRRVIARAVHGRAQPDAPARRDLDDMLALLPSERDGAAVVNAATMELGATVCTARSPGCERCPLAALCAWRAAGYPPSEDRRRKQARYEGSDRQARGGVLRALRHADDHRLPAEAVLSDWPDPAQRDRAIDSLIADGLLEAADGMLLLPR
ncbi:A/G-specific adenine glycosylase [Microbacterium sp.]|uniref:A/G-specific adenine glycosylase n=1 Tax=Microbacterium sp. TaxID=51671 RepID=UPI001AC8CD48|nr:A/G-specific adenine glycosylase [Microbacterium sp.]MBN9156148.1 A/G-specific adenine glycosylase [Microbacterium sp.]MBS1896072.1 A/G-specific adenine glycosylase [Actinomycetota bacterium]MBS1900952.1 A/G-specific adenine glycosylase [Actinomycetota bacterium]